MSEIWKDISEFQGYYQVSNYGRVRRIADYSNQNSTWDHAPKLLKSRKHSNGYLRVMLSVNGKHYDRYIHRLVATEFIDNPNNYKEINHLDGNKKNNHKDNLEWCTRSQNNKHAYAIGLKNVCGCYGKLKKSVAQIDTNTKQIIHIFASIDEASKSVDYLHSMITNCCKGRQNTTRGFKWIYATPEMKVGDIVD